MGGSIMNFRDRITRFRNFALTCSTSLYNEDSMTAQQLNIKSSEKIIECLNMVDTLATGIENINSFLKINYNEDAEELELTIGQQIEALREQVNNSFVCVYDEDSMSALEQAGRMAKAVNECVKTVNMLTDLVEEVNDLIALKYVPAEQMLVVGGEE